MSGRWTEEERIDKVARLTELWEQGLCDREIARELGCANRTVRKIRKQEDLPVNDQRLLSPRIAAERRRHYDAGLSDTEIARIQGVTPESICIWRKRYGLPANRKRRGQARKTGGPGRSDTK